MNQDEPQLHPGPGDALSIKSEADGLNPARVVADQLRHVLAVVETGELPAEPATTNRVEGVVAALDAVAELEW